MINHIYQLVSPRTFSVKYSDIDLTDKVIVRPKYFALCHADQRYYLGKRDAKVLEKKLPMALIHEACGEVVKDPTGRFVTGEKVVMIPNVPGKYNLEIFENYSEGSKFLSSGHDGFMREFVDLPSDRLVAFKKMPFKIAAITEFVSVGVHGATRFDMIAHSHRDTIGIWGDGSLAYVISCVLSRMFPRSKIVVIGKDRSKLSNFSFVANTFLVDSIPNNFKVDHAFECAGGEGSYFAIDDIIKYIKPQGIVILMGVSENKVAINTRDILEKGLTLVGSSRSGKKDFETAVSFMENENFQKRLNAIIFEDEPVSCINDIHRVFATDMMSQFKTVFKWML